MHRHSLLDYATGDCTFKWLGRITGEQQKTNIAERLMEVNALRTALQNVKIIILIFRNETLKQRMQLKSNLWFSCLIGPLI